jgi:hypothetical protein
MHAIARTGDYRMNDRTDGANAVVHLYPETLMLIVQLQVSEHLISAFKGSVPSLDDVINYAVDQLAIRTLGEDGYSLAVVKGTHNADKAIMDNLGK